MSTKLVNVEVIGLRDLRGRFARVTGELQAARRDELRASARRVVALLREEAPVDTGRLRKGIGFKTLNGGQTMRLSITSEAPYTGYVIRGRGPVVAKRAQALRFVINGKVIFRKRVGPTRPNPFQRRALSRAQGEPFDMARRVGRRIQNAWAYGAPAAPLARRD